MMSEPGGETVPIPPDSEPNSLLNSDPDSRVVGAAEGDRPVEQVPTRTYYQLPGQVREPLGYGEAVEFPALQPGELAALPEEPGVYRVETYSGTQHIMTVTKEAVLWERQPAPGSGHANYDRTAVRVQLQGGWEVGSLGNLLVPDGGYAGADTIHRTSFIIRITRIGDTNQA